MYSREQIKCELIKLGCNISYKGFELLLEILFIACENESKFINLRGNIYPEVSQKLNAKAGNIERTIRTLISSLDLQNLIKILNVNLNNKPTVKIFIGLLVEYLNYVL